MHKTRIVFFGTRGQELTACHLEKLVEHGANIVALVEAPVGSISSVHKVKHPYEEIHDTAARLGVPLLCPKTPRDPAFIEQIRALKPDVLISVCYQFYIADELLKLPKHGAINFHTSLLPRHAGMHPGFWSLWYGDKETGMVIHFMDEGLDTGDIIYETRVPIRPGETIQDIYRRSWETSLALCKRLLDDLDAGTLPRTKQDMSQYHYNYDICDRDYELDFRQPAEVLFGRVKMAPGKFYFVLDGQRYYVDDCQAINEHVLTRRFRIGVPFAVDGHLAFATPRQFLRIDAIRRDGSVIDPTSLIPPPAAKKG